MGRLALYHYLSFLAAPAPLTMFDGIYKLPAATWMQVDASGRMQATRYWRALPGQGMAAGALDGLSGAARLASQDPSEASLSGIEVTLQDSRGITRTDTTVGGTYSFGGLSSGSYTVTVNPASLLPIANTTTPSEGFAVPTSDGPT